MISVSVEGFPCGQTSLALVRAWLLSATFEKSQHLWYQWIYFKTNHLVGRTAGTLGQVRERSHDSKWVAKLISKCKNEMHPTMLTQTPASGLKLWCLGGKQVKHSQIPAQLGDGNLQLEEWGARGQVPSLQLLVTSPKPKALCPATLPRERGQSPSRRYSFHMTTPKQRGSKSSAMGFNSDRVGSILTPNM